MTQYECLNSTQVAKKVCELCNLPYTQNERKVWRDYCRTIRHSKVVSNNIDYVQFNDNEEVDCSIFLGYDKETNSYLVGIED